MYNWNGFQYVMALEEGGTMRRAAELLGTNATTVSRNIKRMYEQHGTMLFSMQKGGNWETTPDGKEFLNLALEFKVKLDRLKLMGEEVGERQQIIVTSVEFLLAEYLTPCMNELTKQMPNVEIALIGADRRLSLAYGQAHLALRFGRPTEGNLVASKIASISFGCWVPKDQQDAREWVGLPEELDWTPEMQMGYDVFGKPPFHRASSFDAVRKVAASCGYGAVGPCIVMHSGGALVPRPDSPSVERDVWSVIHETNKLNHAPTEVRQWARDTIVISQNRLRERHSCAPK